MKVFLLPIGRDGYELYSEPPPDAHASAGDSAAEKGVSSLLHRLRHRWTEVVQRSRNPEPGPRNRFGRWRDKVVCRMAESIAEQRTLWALRDAAFAELVFPSDIEASEARGRLDRSLGEARRHHRLWLLVDLVAFALSGLLMLLPGPNLVAYYFAFRLVGHYLSWRGADRGLRTTKWDVRAEAALAELRPLAEVPRESRAARVEAIATQLDLPRLSAFFDRAAFPAG